MVDDNRRSSAEVGLFAPARKLPWSAPFRWLALGWQDYRNAKAISHRYGLFFAAIGLVLAVTTWLFHDTLFLLSLCVLFVLLGPLFAFGLYDIPRQLERGEVPTLKHSINQIRASAPNQWVFAVVVIVIGLLWMRAATIVHIFYPQHNDPTFEELMTFFVIGTGAGAFFSGLVFGISAFSLPMMVDRNVDAITAALSSLSAVMNNLWIMALWALLIALLIVLGFATLFLGLIWVLPVIGYATWHGYQEAIEQ